MKIKTKLLTIAVLGSLFGSVELSATNANIQGCHSFFEYLDEKLDHVSPKYPKSDVKFVKKGFREYNDYIKKEIDRKLSEYFQGDKSQIDNYKKEIDTGTKMTKESYNKRYKDDILYADFALTIEGCAKVVPVKGARLEALKTTYKRFLKLVYMK